MLGHLNGPKFKGTHRQLPAKIILVKQVDGDPKQSPATCTKVLRFAAQNVYIATDNTHYVLVFIVS